MRAKAGKKFYASNVGRKSFLGTCELCKRHPIEVTRHHLIPRARHRKGSTRRRFTREEATGRVALLCRACHRFIHSRLTEREMADEFDTMEKLRAHPDIDTFVNWIANKATGLRVHSARKK